MWNLYTVSASEFNEYAARFCLDFHCRPTNHPISMRLVWPLFVEGNYLFKHNLHGEIGAGMLQFIGKGDGLFAGNDLEVFSQKKQNTSLVMDNRRAGRGEDFLSGSAVYA